MPARLTAFARETLPAPLRGETRGLRSEALGWKALQDLQLRHDRNFHRDVESSSPAYQIRHSIMHLHKVAASLATLTEKSFHREAINDAELDLAERRLPDLQAFVFKIANVAGVDTVTVFSRLGRSIVEAQQQGARPTGDRTEWLEHQLVRLEQGMVKLAEIHPQLMAKPNVSPAIRRTIRSALKDLQHVALALANSFDRDLESLYEERILKVEHRKLA